MEEAIEGGEEKARQGKREVEDSVRERRTKKRAKRRRYYSSTV